MGLTKIYVLKYNNYYNRIIKKFDTINEYITDHEYAQYNNQNFWDNDGINTECVLNDSILNNGPVYPQSNPASLKDCDYLINVSDTGDILSRWFIIVANQARTGQYQLQLHRDLIADNYETVFNSPVYVEKATIRDINDSAVYNKEDLDVNQVKQKEILLKDDSEVGWIIGYMDNTTPATTATVEPYENVIRTSTLESWDFYNYVTTNPSFDYYKVKSGDYLQVRYMVRNFGAQKAWKTFEVQNNGSVHSLSQYSLEPSYYPLFFHDSEADNYSIGTAIHNSFEQTKLTIYNDNNWKKYNQNFEDIDALRNKILYDTTANKYYKIVVNSNGSSLHNEWIDEESSLSQTITTNIVDSLRDIGFTPVSVENPSNPGYYFIAYYNKYSITLVETTLSSGSTSVTIPADSNVLRDAPYKMFAIPADFTYFKKISGQTEEIYPTLNRQEALSLAANLATSLTSHLIDIQLLPYFPMTDALIGGWMDISTLTEGKDYSFVKKNNNANVGIVFYPKESSFKNTISVSDNFLTLPETPRAVKIAMQCEKLRLCSPNYSSMFDYSLYAVGDATKYDIECTYKPYSPYIRVHPKFGRLYGDNFNDSRGLILQGDYSLPVMTDQWKTFQVNNKNYLNAFNREIDTIELQNKYGKAGDITKAITGTFTGAASGAMAGGLAGGGVPGAIVGAAIGGVTSAVGGVADVIHNEKLRIDALDLKKDLFNYSLQNIMAQPRTVAKLSSYDINNKLWPFIEVYYATDVEVEAFKNKLDYNGMTINRIDYLRTFYLLDEPAYFKGQLIRNTEINVDFNTMKAISDELYKGVFI